MCVCLQITRAGIFKQHKTMRNLLHVVLLGVCSLAAPSPARWVGAASLAPRHSIADHPRATPPAPSPQLPALGLPVLSAAAGYPGFSRHSTWSRCAPTELGSRTPQSGGEARHTRPRMRAPRSRGEARHTMRMPRSLGEARHTMRTPWFRGEVR